MLIQATTRPLTAQEKHLPLNNWFNLQVVGWLSFLILPLMALGATKKKRIIDKLRCPSCGECALAAVETSYKDEASHPRRNLKVLISPDFIGSAIVVFLLAALLFGFVISQPLQDIMTKGGLLLIGLLVAAILFLLRIFLLPLLHEALHADNPPS
ncbi:MAG: hypothetical protein Q8K62_11890 [Thiobacillus sp.]|nr:hypothetical protein [Thiobacillus sp.]